MMTEQERAIMSDVLKLLDSLDYERDEDSSSMSFFGARLCEDSFFYTKHQLEDLLKGEA